MRFRVLPACVGVASLLVVLSACTREQKSESKTITTKAITTAQALPSASAGPHVIAAPATPLGLQASLDKLASEIDGTVSVSVRHLRLNALARVHADKRMPMMSVYKLPLAIATFADLEAGKLKLGQVVPITESELRPGVSPIAEAWVKGKHSVTLEFMLLQMLQESDNTAGDKLVAMLGGGPAITARLRTLGLTGIDIAEQELDIFARIECAGQARPKGGWTPKTCDACPKPKDAVLLEAAKQEVSAPPNGTTADAMTALLAALENGTVLASDSRKWILETMYGTNTGARRLRALLPPATKVANRTGTGDTYGGMNIATNDVGIITFPNGDKVAMSVFISGSSADEKAREATIAKLAKAVWDRFAGL